MSSIEQMWHSLEEAAEFGGARRLSANSRHDFYALLDVDGRRGMLLISSSKPPQPPALEAVQVSIGERADARWSLNIKLRAEELKSVFAEMCKGIIEASESVAEPNVPSFVVSRLTNWRELLEAGAPGTLGLNALRGLVGELSVMRRCLELVDPPSVIDGWIGPSHAPQDFALPKALLEVKAIRPSAVGLPISSIEQLDVPSGVVLILCVVRLATVQAEASDAFAPAALVSQIRTVLSEYPQASVEFDSRLRLAGYDDNADYQQVRFRTDAVRFYRVTAEFPKLRRLNLPEGILDARYDVAYAACDRFEVALDEVLS